MTLRNITLALAAFGALLNAAFVFLAADPGVFEGFGILVGLFMAAISAGPFLLAWPGLSGKPPSAPANLVMLFAVAAAIAFSVYVQWEFLQPAGKVPDPLVMAVIPLYLWPGLGVAAFIRRLLP